MQNASLICKNKPDASGYVAKIVNFSFSPNSVRKKLQICTKNETAPGENRDAVCFIVKAFELPYSP